MADRRSAGQSGETPTLPAMHAGLVLAGLGTALLGPILPLVAHQWQLLDSQSGLLMAAKFCGAFVGGVTVSKKLKRGLVVGFLAAALGFFGFAISPGLMTGCATLALGGFGIGRTITATNILAGRRFTAHRGSALSLLNFSFSAGAMLSALGAAWLLPKFPLRGVLEGFAAAFAVVALWIGVQGRGTSDDEVPVEAGGAGFGGGLFAYFIGLLFLYGGLETCLGGWLTTFALRYGDKSFALSEYTTLVFWMALTVGRAGSSALMLRVSERTLQRSGLVASALCVAGLGVAHGGLAIALVAMLLGLSLSPFFPSTFSLLMADRPTASQAGVVMSASGLGAAALPWAMGVVSTRTGSLQMALILPLGAAVGLLGMSFLVLSQVRSERAAAVSKA
ncbi:MFS transporter [Granulicella sibirica]|uniref:Major facilitator superfamily MFS_1 n=1 Tax=Granulicella sibirica TaxID=2479048 RepID=A0A4Q0T4C0_9BACT|nr:MFS transporter [Granulicella sibirica]RXH56839.1 major facilitator superfamily MFS_1 [Granulicella sibirica]